MVVNLELFLAYNTLMDGLILLLALRIGGVVYGKKYLVPRVFFGGFLGAVSSAVCIAYSLRYAVLITVIGWLGMVFVAFGVVRARIFLRILCMSAVLSCLLGGAGFFMLFHLGGNFSVWMGMGLIVIGIVASRVFIASRAKRSQAESLGILKIVTPRAEIILSALVDSGNSLVEPISGLPVIVAGKGIEITSDMPGFRIVPFNTVSGRGIMTCFKPDAIYFDGKPITAYVAVSPAPIRFDALVPPAAFARDVSDALPPQSARHSMKEAGL